MSLFGTLLGKPQRIGRDGKIFLPYVGHAEVLGMTKQEVTKVVSALLCERINMQVSLDVRFL